MLGLCSPLWPAFSSPAGYRRAACVLAPLSVLACVLNSSYSALTSCAEICRLRDQHGHQPPGPFPAGQPADGGHPGGARQGRRRQARHHRRLHHRQHQHPRRQCAAQGAPHSSVSPCDTSSICQQNTSTSPAICRPRFRAPFVPHVDSDMCPMAILLATPIPSRQPAAQKTPCCFFHQCRTCVYFCHLPLGVCSTS